MPEDEFRPQINPTKVLWVTQYSSNPLCNNRAKNKSQTMKHIIELAAENETPHPELTFQNGQQLNLSFLAGSRPSAAFRRRQILRSRAQYWFGIIYRVVDNAVEWKPAPPPRPEQTALDLCRVTEVRLIE